MFKELDTTGWTPRRLKNSSDYLTMLPIPQKLKDLMHMDKPSITTSKAFKTVLISTTVSLKQDFMLLKLSSTTLSKTLNSYNKLRELGIMPPPLNKLKLLERALILGEILMKLNNSTINLRRPDKLLSNTFKFPTFLLLGKTKSKEELNSTWLISLLHQQVNKSLPKSIKMLMVFQRLLNKILLSRLSQNPERLGLNQLKFKLQYNNLMLGQRPNKLKNLRQLVKV